MPAETKQITIGKIVGDTIVTISLYTASERKKTRRSVDLLGCVYEYFTTHFTSAEGNNGDQFDTSALHLTPSYQNAHAPKGSIYDPSWGFDGMFMQPESL